MGTGKRWGIVSVFLFEYCRHVDDVHKNCSHGIVRQWTFVVIENELNDRFDSGRIVDGFVAHHLPFSYLGCDDHSLVQAVQYVVSKVVYVVSPAVESRIFEGARVPNKGKEER